MTFLEILRVTAGLLFLILPGILLTFLLFRGKEMNLIERVALGSGLSISLIVIILFAGSKLLGVNLNLTTIVITIGVASLVIALAQLRRGIPPLPSLPRPLRLSRDRVFRYLGLLAVLVFAFFMAFMPHLGYRYPLHIDEWYHYDYSQALTEAKGLPFAEPFYGEAVVTDHHEIGFHIFLSQVKLLTGLTWVKLFLLFPGLIFLMTVLTAFAIGERAGYGLEVAFFVSLIPTTVRFLGPSFLVPVALGLFLLASTLFLLHWRETTGYRVIALFLLLAFLFLSHPPTAVAASLLSFIYGTIAFLEGTGKGRWRDTLPILACVLLASILGFSRYWEKTVARAMEITGPQSTLPLIGDALPKFGFIPLALFAAGCGLLAYKRGWRSFGLIASAGVFLAIVILYCQLGIGVPILYDRAFLYFFLVAGIIAGYATSSIRELLTGFMSRFTRSALLLSLLVTLILIASSGFISIRSHLREPYYRLITEKQYLDALRVREELDISGRTLVHPRLAIAFAPLSGRAIYASDAAIILIYPERIGEVEGFMSTGASDTDWLSERGIAIVYTELTVNNPDLVKLGEGLYLVPAP